MRIQIHPDALRGQSEDLLWSGALYGLKRLQQMGHEVYFNASSLSDRQQKLLQNEGIASTMPENEEQDENPDDTDLLVNVAEGKLTAIRRGNLIWTEDDWTALSERILFPKRSASHQRKTAETDVTLQVNLDGTGKSSIDTGLDFLDHMLDQLARHGLVDIELTCDGDLEVDEHHTIEDVAIALGEVIGMALGDKVGIQRYAFALPMDESQSQVVLDLSGRPYLVFEGEFRREMVGDLPTEMVEHFFYSLAMHLKATLHIKVQGKNDHHKIEACFKGFARCLRAAVSRSERNLNILPSTKDLL